MWMEELEWRLWKRGERFWGEIKRIGGSKD